MTDKDDLRNLDDVDPISHEKVCDLAKNSRFVVDMGGGVRHAYDADAWLTHLVTPAAAQQRARAHVTTRQPLRPTEVWECFNACLQTALDTWPVTDDRIQTCLSHRIEGVRSADGKVSLCPVSPLFNMRVRRMGAISETEDVGGPVPRTNQKRVKIVYDLVDSRDASRAVTAEATIVVLCPAADTIAVR